jgi:AsmA-like C-terminal region
VKKWLKISLRVLAILIGLLILAFAGAWIYLKQHKKQVITYIESEAKKGLNGGSVHIGDVSIGFKHTFPRIAFTIDTLVLRDSLWFQHHHDLINVKRAYATLDFFKLIVGKISIGRVQLIYPDFYIYTDSTGYTNTSIFKKNQPSHKDAPKNLEYPILEIQNGSLTVDKKDKGKIFDFDDISLECHIKGNSIDPGLTIDASLDCMVQKLTFNQAKGPFLDKKNVKGDIRIQFNKDSKILQFEKIKLAVDHQPFVFTGKFFLAEIPTPFILSWETNHLSFRKAASFLSQSIRLKLDEYNISETITHLTGSLDNSEPEYKTPLIHLWLKVDGRDIKTPVVNLNNTSFIATFNNEEVKGRGHEDSNTVMRFLPLKGSIEKLKFKCDSIVIRNLIHPKMNLHIVSDFQLEDINNYMDENEMAFTKGSGNFNFIYSGSLEKNYDSLRTLTGNINLDSAAINYVPRNLLFTKGKGVIRFTGRDMIVDNLNLYSGSTDLIMNGSIKSIFYLINQNNNKLTFDWNIRSEKLNLNDFIAYMKQKRAASVPEKKKSSLAQTLTKFTKLLETADFNLSLNARHLVYQKFYGDNLVAKMDMNDNFINLKDIKLQHAGGSMAIRGILRNEVSSNPFSFKTELRNVNVSKIFYAFNNFGMSSLTDKNIEGVLTADVTMQGGLTSKAQLIPEELKGFVKFNLQNGKLINFEPVQKIQQTVFKDRNFSDIQFADLHDLLEINGHNITVNRMEIRSSVMTMFVEGMYNMKTGPDLSIQVPLSNLKKQKDSALENKGIFSKTGVSARLRVQRGEDGKTKITWDPLNKATKQMKKKSKSSKSGK